MALSIGAKQLTNIDIGAIQSTSSTNITLTPGAYSIVITGGTPSIDILVLVPGSGTITLTGGTPTITPFDLAPAPGTITLVGGTPSINPLDIPAGTGSITLTPGLPGVSLVTTTATGSKVIIGSTTYFFDQDNPATIQKRLSSAWTATFSLVYTSGSKPQPGQEVALFWQSVKRFGGVVLSTSESRIKGPANVTRIVVTCTGFQSYLNRVVIATLYPPMPGGYQNQIADVYTNHLSQFGVTFVSGQGPAGDTESQLAHYITGAEVFSRIRSNNAGWDYWIDDNKGLYWRLQGTGDAAPFTIRDGDVNQDSVTVGTSNAKFRNRQWVLPSANIQGLTTETFVIAVEQTQVYLTARLTQTPVVKRNGTEETVAVWSGTDGDAVWHWLTQAQYAGPTPVFRSPLAAPMSPGDIVTVTYPLPFPNAVFVEDAVSIAAVGLYESVYQAKNVVDEGTATALAQALLDAYGTDGDFPQSFKFTYNSQSQSAWLLPGMVVDVLRTFPDATGNYVVEEIVSALDHLTVWRHTVTLRLGLGDITDTFERDFLTAGRVPIVSPPVRITFELDLTNGGQTIGTVTNRYIVQLPPGVVQGVIQSWDGQFPADPPTGDDYIADILLNGTSIFPSGDANKMVIPDGRTSQVVGQTFDTANLVIVTGDVFSFVVLQVGSTTPGSYALFHLNYVV